MLKQKNALLNKSLGFEKDIHLTSGEETDDDEDSSCFSSLDLVWIANKNALLESAIEESITNHLELKPPVQVEFVLPPGLESAHVEENTGSTETADEKEEVHMVVPPEVAAFLRNVHVGTK